MATIEAIKGYLPVQHLDCQDQKSGGEKTLTPWTLRACHSLPVLQEPSLAHKNCSIVVGHRYEAQVFGDGEEAMW